MARKLIISTSAVMACEIAGHPVGTGPRLAQRFMSPGWPAFAGHDSGGVMARKLIIDGKEIEADDNITLLQACEQAGAEIPRFCYHERLSRRRQLPHVSGRMGRRAEAAGVLRAAGEGHLPEQGRHARQDQHQHRRSRRRRAKA